MTTIEMVMEKATKNTIRFTEVLENELAAPVIGTIYVPKATLSQLKWKEGEKLIVTIDTKK